MDSALVTILILFALGLAGLLYNRKNAMEAKELGARMHSVGIHIYGVPGIGEKEFVKLFFTDDKLIIKGGGKTVELAYDRLTAIKAASKTDLLKKDRSVIGRGIAGGLLLGPLGAIIGGMSAVGKQKHIKGQFLILNYIPAGQDETKVMAFDMKNLASAKKIERFVMKKVPRLAEPEHITL